MIDLAEIIKGQSHQTNPELTGLPDDVKELVVDESDHREVRVVQLLGVLEDLGALDGLVGREALEVLVVVGPDQD